MRFDLDEFIEAIVSISVATDWAHAREEWRPINVQLEDNAHCDACGKHWGIEQVVLLANKLNGKFLKVGMNCYCKFRGYHGGNVYRCVARQKCNQFMIRMAHEVHLIDDWEMEFMLDVWRKRKFTARQRARYDLINRRIINAFRRDLSEEAKR